MQAPTCHTYTTWRAIKSAQRKSLPSSYLAKNTSAHVCCVNDSCLRHGVYFEMDICCKKRGTQQLAGDVFVLLSAKIKINLPQNNGFQGLWRGNKGCLRWTYMPFLLGSPWTDWSVRLRIYSHASSSVRSIIVLGTRQLCLSMPTCKCLAGAMLSMPPHVGNIG